MNKSGFIKYYVVGLTLISLTALFLSLNSSGDVKKLKQELSRKDQQIKQLMLELEKKDKKIQQITQEKQILVEKLKIIEEKIERRSI